MSTAAVQQNERSVWYGALTLGVVAAVAVWTLRLLLNRDTHPSGRLKPGLVVAAVIVLVVLYVTFRAWALVAAAVPALVALATFGITDAGGRPGLVAATIGAFAAVSLVVACQWSNRLMRVTVASFAVAALVLTVRSGRAELEEVRLRRARGTVVSLVGKVAEVSVAADKKVGSLADAARAAYDAAHKVLADRVGGDPDTPRPGGCAQVAPDSVDSTLCDLSSSLDVALQKVQGPSRPSLQNEMDRLAALGAANTVSEGNRVRISAFVAAVTAIEAALRPPPAPAAVVEKAWTTVGKLCTGAGGAWSGEPPYACTKRPGGRGDGPRALDVLTAEAARDVAAAGAAVTKADTDTKALTTAEGAVATATTQQDDPAPANSVAATVTAGAQRLARYVPAIGGTRVPLDLGPLGWACSEASPSAATGRSRSSTGIGAVAW